MDILKHIYLPVAVATALVLSSCYRDIAPDIHHAPVLAMSGMITAGEPVELKLTHTWRYDTTDGTNIDSTAVAVPDGRLVLSVNDGEPMELTRAGDITFYADYIPAAGDRLTFTAESPTYGTATSTVSVPQAPPIDRFEATVLSQSGTYADGHRIDASVNMRLWFTDPAESEDFYMVTVKEQFYGEAGDCHWISIDYEREPLFSEMVSPIESIFGDATGYTMFTDRTIAGRTYGLTLATQLNYFVNTTDPSAEPNIMTITFSAISDSYYKYLLSIYQSTDSFNGTLADLGLGYEFYSYSNVSTGAGIIATRADSVTKLNLTELLRNATDNNASREIE